MIPEESIEQLEKEKLLQLTKIFAKNWLAHDGCWFLAIEESQSMDIAIKMDTEAWRRFTVIEAKRLIDFLELGNDSGVDGLAKALNFRLYSALNEDKVEILSDTKLRYYVKTCRVQHARESKGMPLFPCKSVGIVEYSLFAKTIDSRFITNCLSCPPERNDTDFYCIWEFELNK